MRDKIGDKARLLHIIEAITAIEKYVFDTDYDGFSSNSMMVYASVK